MAEVKTRQVPVSSLKLAPWNPRTIRDERFKSLCRSMQKDPDFLEERPVLATLDGTVYAGNMRVRAALHLKWKTIPARLIDIPERLAQERALIDNNQFGDWSPVALREVLAKLNDGQQDYDNDMLGFEPSYLERLFKESEASEPKELKYEPGEVGKSTAEKKATEYDQTAVRMVVLYYTADEFGEIVDMLAWLRERYDAETNTEAITALLKETYAATPQEPA